jgi:hypothetical protein
MTSDAIVQCPKCPKKFLSLRLKEHLAEHADEEAERNAEAALNPFPSNSTFFEPSQSNIDATKDIGYPARDYKSRYGSYPGHDGFDDESSS